MDPPRIYNLFPRLAGDLTRWVVRDQQHQIEHLNAYITDTQVSSAFS